MLAIISIKTIKLVYETILQHHSDRNISYCIKSKINYATKNKIEATFTQATPQQHNTNKLAKTKQ